MLQSFSNIDQKNIAMLEELAELVNRSAREYVRCLEDARDLSHNASRAEIGIPRDRRSACRASGTVGSAERIVRERLIRNAPTFVSCIASAVPRG